MSDPILVLLCAWLAGEELRPLLVELDEILSVFPALGFILVDRSTRSLLPTQHICQHLPSSGMTVATSPVEHMQSSML